MSFSNFGLSDPVMKSLEKLQFKTPTPIQEQTIPPALEGRDIMGFAQTGTGKTAAFAIPLVEKLLANPSASALVLTPTRELALQVLQAITVLLPPSYLSQTALLIGGEPLFKQIQKLRKRPRLIVGTPGRINDHLVRKTLSFSNTSFVVFDETDRMLDMGFAVQIDAIIEHLPEERQTLLFSATLPPNVEAVSKKYLKNPIRISTGKANQPAANIVQEVVEVSEKEKYSRLTSEIEKREGSVIVFVKTKMHADSIAHSLKQDDHSADAIHGDLHQRQRARVIRGFKDRKSRILVATDLAARGLDIPHVEHVINYDLPQCPEDYIHRIGRTARAGGSGSALSFVTKGQQGLWRDIQNLMHPEKKQTPSSSFSSETGKKRPPFGFKKRGSFSSRGKKGPFFKKEGEGQMKRSSRKPVRSKETLRNIQKRG